ncbi:amino acid ABC transporter ATP-binding protein [Bartonella tamiae]|uniref:ABC transporter domain-containing protein n=1 Tax=Bartonella tamiae Th239 TaxID=1094558 RepID=J0R196_9HYPH|nr:amino acid ABC transporter ATP-binding protein [Bartonella tamiae]EJF89324.1 hypothetical protein ME5_01875 [Bartonella tamiae Th239]EJF95514.1 hypothetical protein MEG_00004 [Bartonella tamiae Th307]
MSEYHDPSQAIIVMENVNKYYGSYTALKNINLKVQAGERIVLCGPSGSGKSTLIRTLNQLENVNEGLIKIDGIDIVNGATREVKTILREVGMVFQHFNLFPHMTALENCILAPISVRKISKKDAIEQARSYLERVGLEKHETKYPAQLSGGQQQRVAIARALCMTPRIMLFDEPTSALDPEMVGEVLDVLIKLAQTGMTMMCVTHEMVFARQFSERVLFIENGDIIEDSTPEIFFNNPSSQRSRDFLKRIQH